MKETLKQVAEEPEYDVAPPKEEHNSIYAKEFEQLDILGKGTYGVCVLTPSSTI